VSLSRSLARGRGAERLIAIHELLSYILRVDLVGPVADRGAKRGDLGLIDRGRRIGGGVDRLQQRLGLIDIGGIDRRARSGSRAVRPRAAFRGARRIDSRRLAGAN